MTTLAPASLTKLAKICALFSSNHDGERAAAAAKADAMIKAAGITWHQVLSPPTSEKKLPELGTWRQTAARCLERPGCLRQWEIGFLRDLPGFRRLSVRQRYVLNEIASRVLKDRAP